MSIATIFFGGEADVAQSIAKLLSIREEERVRAERQLVEPSGIKQVLFSVLPADRAEARALS